MKLDSPSALGYACSRDPTRPELAYVTLSKGDLNRKGTVVMACATDGHRAVVATMPASALLGLEFGREAFFKRDAKTWDEPVPFLGAMPDWRQVVRGDCREDWTVRLTTGPVILALRAQIASHDAAMKKIVDAHKADLKARRTRLTLAKNALATAKKTQRAAMKEAKRRLKTAEESAEIKQRNKAVDDARKERDALGEPPTTEPSAVFDHEGLRVGETTITYSDGMGAKKPVIVNAAYLLDALRHKGANAVVSGDTPLTPIRVDTDPRGSVFDVIMPMRY